MRENRIKDLAKFDICEDFADRFNVSVEYVWTEFIDPNFYEYGNVANVLNRFFPEPEFPLDV